MFSTSQSMFIRMASFTPVALQEIGTTVARARDSEGNCSQLRRISFRSESILTSDCRNINIPWPDQGMGDGDYMWAFQKVVMPIATEFNPDLVISKSGSSMNVDIFI
jgi:hypothetical protein